MSKVVNDHPGLRATFSADPIKRIPPQNFVRLSNRCFLIASLTARELASLLWIPVGQTLPETAVEQRMESPWQRQLFEQSRDDPYPSGLPYVAPLVVSGRDTWLYHDDHIEIFESGAVLDGAVRLQWLTQYQPDTEVPFMLIMDLHAHEEWEIRQTLEPPTSDGSSTQTIAERRQENLFDTDTQRLKIGVTPVRATIWSEPFVVRTSFNYVPAIFVRREGEPAKEHLIVGPRSLFTPLEEIIAERGKLTGAIIEVAKTSDARSAPYQVSYLGSSES